MEKPRVLFFSRDYQAEFFPFLTSERYETIHITLKLKEKAGINKLGFSVAGCFEEEFDDLPVASFRDDYLETSFSADRYLRFSPIEDRRRILGKEISFWKRLFDKYQPSLVVNETVAIEISEVLYLTAKERNIRYSSWMSFPTNKFYWQSVAIHNSFDQSVFEKEPNEQSQLEADTYIAKVKEGSGKPFYAANVRSRFSPYALARNIYWYLRCTLTEHKYGDRAKNQVIFGDNAPFYAERLSAFVNSMFHGYDDLEKFKEYEIVFYPLHYEPEAVLFYMAEFFENQLTLVENLAKCLKLNQVLVLKEHPQQTGMLLDKRYRDLKKRVSNLVYLPGEFRTTQLLEKCKVLVTLGSTAGVEALILGKPVIVMAKMFYDKYPDVNVISSYPEIREAIRGDNLKYPNEQSLRRFLAQVITHSREGNPFPHKGLYDELNLKRLVAAIEDELPAELEKHPN